MSDYKVESEYEILTTNGLGPCIGVAFSYKGKGFMMHENMPHISVDVLQNMLSQAKIDIPQEDRGDIHPVVAGGGLGGNSNTNSNILLSRDYVIKELNKLGFGKPNTFWCKQNSGKNLHLYIYQNEVEIVTTYFSGNEENDSSQSITVSLKKLSI